jgi:hypothetical protein
MASTRNKNSTGNYTLELEGKKEQAQYKMNEVYSVPPETNQPGQGLLAGSVGPAKLAANYCDIESELRGIGSTNLVTPMPKVTPYINDLRSLNVSNRIPLILPKSYQHNNEERPFRGLA